MCENISQNRPTNLLNFVNNDVILIISNAKWTPPAIRFLPSIYKIFLSEIYKPRSGLEVILRGFVYVNHAAWRDCEMTSRFLSGGILFDRHVVREGNDFVQVCQFYFNANKSELMSACVLLLGKILSAELIFFARVYALLKSPSTWIIKSGV